MSDAGYVGARKPADGSSDFDATSFIVTQLLGKMWTCTLVQVIAVYGGVIGQPPTVDVQPMVNQLDGLGQPMPHGTVFGIPCARIKGGPHSIICDPQVGDIGVAVFASRDISSVLASGAPANPGSYRQHSASDGIYLMGLLGPTPTSYILMNNGGSITITVPNTNSVTVNAGTVGITATTATITAGTVNLGGTGGAAVARVGDTVAGGVITSGSSKVKAVS